MAEFTGGPPCSAFPANCRPQRSRTSSQSGACRSVMIPGLSSVPVVRSVTFVEEVMIATLFVYLGIPLHGLRIADAAIGPLHPAIVPAEVDEVPGVIDLRLPGMEMWACRIMSVLDDHTRAA